MAPARLVAGAKGTDMPRKRRDAQETESIRNVIRLLLVDAGLALLILHISITYGEQPRVGALLALLMVAVVAIGGAVGLWKFRNTTWLRRVMTVVAILVLFVLVLVAKVIWPLIVREVYVLGVVAVCLLVGIGIVIWMVASIKEIKEKRRKKAATPGSPQQ